MIGSARVHCQDCEFDWFGRSAAHGLAILGQCPRCGGTLVFAEPAPTAPPSADDAELALAPSRVLGLPGVRP